jgi:D-alanyl-D-alanine carboxypeptidase
VTPRRSEDDWRGVARVRVVDLPNQTELEIFMTRASSSPLKSPLQRGRLAMAVLSCLVAVVAFGDPAQAASDTGTNTCPTDRNVPGRVAAKLDSTLLMIIDGGADSADMLGFAPGAELFVRSPDWTYHRSAGTSDITTRASLDCGRPFQIGSNTKMMAAAVLMQLVEEGALLLDDRLATHLPDVATALPFGDAITIRQMANHTSGIFSYTDNAPNGAPGIMEGALSDQDLLARSYSPDDLVRFVIDNGAPSFEPGAEGRWSYSNSGYVLIGMILEKVTSKPLSDLFRERIFAPLGMRHSFLWNAVPRPEFNLPRSYYEPPFDIDTTGWNMSQAWAAGGVISTARDMDLFIRGVLAGDLFNDPTTLLSMMDGVATDGGFQTYGIGIGEKIGGFWGHGGQTLGFESDIGLFRDQGISLIVWTNSARNLAGLGATLVFGALGDADALEERGDAIRSLSGTRWVWVSATDPSGQTFRVEDPQRYGISFQDGGDLAVKADCNRGPGSYSGDGDALSLVARISTKALCPADSLEDDFLKRLEDAIGFRRHGESLVLFLGQGRESMEFANDTQD